MPKSVLRKKKKAQRKERRKTKKAERKKIRKSVKKTRKQAKRFKGVDLPGKDVMVQQLKVKQKKSRQTGVAVGVGGGLAIATLASGGGALPALGAFVGGAFGTGVLQKSPTAKEAVGSAFDPSKILEKGHKIGEKIEKEPEKKKSRALDLVKGAGVGGLVAGTGALLLPKLKKEDRIKPLPTPSIPMEKQPTSPILPQTTKVSPTKTRSKRRRATKTPQVRQSVSIKINNSSKSTGVRISKKYLNERVLCNLC